MRVETRPERSGRLTDKTWFLFGEVAQWLERHGFLKKKSLEVGGSSPPLPLWEHSSIESNLGLITSACD